MLGKIEGRRRRGWQDETVGWHHRSMDMRLSKLWEIVKNKEACYATVHGVTKSWTPLSDWTTTIVTRIGKYFEGKNDCGMSTHLFPVAFSLIQWMLAIWSLVPLSSVQLLSCVQLFATPWTAACQASLSVTNFQSLLKCMSIASVMPSNHLMLCRPLLLLPSIFPSIRVFSNESVLRIRWPKYWSFSFSVSASNEYSGLISFRTD